MHISSLKNLFKLDTARRKRIFAEIYEDENKQSTIYPKSALQFKTFKGISERYSANVKYLSIIPSRLCAASLNWDKLLTAHCHFLPRDCRCQQKCYLGGVQLSATVCVCQKKIYCNRFKDKSQTLPELKTLFTFFRVQPAERAFLLRPTIPRKRMTMSSQQFIPRQTCNAKPWRKQWKRFYFSGVSNRTSSMKSWTQCLVREHL